MRRGTRVSRIDAGCGPADRLDDRCKTPARNVHHLAALNLVSSPSIFRDRHRPSLSEVALRASYGLRQIDAVREARLTFLSIS